MTSDRIPALLEPIQSRLNAATPGPWFREYSDVITSDPDPRDVEEGYDDPRSMRIVRAAPHLNKREPQGIKNADFIANAPMDQARLLAAVQAADEALSERASTLGETAERMLTEVLADRTKTGDDHEDARRYAAYASEANASLKAFRSAVVAALGGEA